MEDLPTLLRTAAATLAAAAPRSAAPSQDHQGRATVTAVNGGYNGHNGQARTELMCAAMRAQLTGVVIEALKPNRADTGVNTIGSMAVAIAGDTATASITGTDEASGTGTITLPLKRDDGRKVCQVYHR